MSLVLIWGNIDTPGPPMIYIKCLSAGANKPVVRIARMAGQFAKWVSATIFSFLSTDSPLFIIIRPRSSPTEMVNGKEIPSFRGDNINGFDPSERTPDPSRLVRWVESHTPFYHQYPYKPTLTSIKNSAYFHSATTLNYIRAQISSGIADLHNPLDWNLGHVQSATIKAKYQRIVSSITDSLRFMKTIGADTAGQLQTVDFYTSHEGLLLEYEQSLTRRLKHPSNHHHQPTSTSEGWYNTSAHFLWIGDRTRQPQGAHVEYFRGLENPMGIKVGPTTTTTDLVELLEIINPRKEIGKVTLITRYGEKHVSSKLGEHIEAVRRSGHTVIWQCDPMHGNTITIPQSGLKTRNFNAIYAELSTTLRIHHEHDSFLGGVHLELTGDAVTECVGGSENLTDQDLPLNYTTFCDPRLNEKQALELAFLIAEDLRIRDGKS